MRLYADAAAYAAYTQGEAPTNVDTLLRAASRAVDLLLTGRAYDTDTNGLPTDPDVARALSDAACGIAAECAATGVLSPGGTQEWASVGIGNVSLAGAKLREGTVAVAGLPVPATVLLALADVGTIAVTVGGVGCYVRPLDRVVQ